MEKELITIEEVSRSVETLTKFDVTKQELEDRVSKTKMITVSDLKDQKQLAIVKETRLDLRGIEISIEKRGKSFRDIFTKANKKIMEMQNELLAITSPEIERLVKIEAEAKQIKWLEDQELLWPERLSRLESINDTLPIVKDALFAMEDNAFEAYYNQRVADKNNADRLAIEKETEEKRRVEDARLEAERQKIADDKAKIEAEAEEKRKAEQDKIDAENAKLVAERKAIEDEKLRLKHEEDVRVATAKAKEDERLRLESVAKEAEERKKQEAEDERVKLEKEEASRPDKQCLADYGRMLNAVVPPKLRTEEANTVLNTALGMLKNLTDFLINQK